ncbi:MAG TPA: hypothetical protein VHF87_02015 [Methylomirabilota bacterium]|jgi:hypothetical protein|nr:hypothetical protein [Methylomirabilota bacterium]
MPIQEARYRQAAWTYVAYGVVYWLGGLALASSGLGPRGMERGGTAWFVVGALFVVVFPWLLTRERGWFDRWILSRRDFARILTLLVALRAIEVARIAWAPRAETVSVLGIDVSMRAGAWTFCLLTVVTAVMLARAAWSRQR